MKRAENHESPMCAGCNRRDFLTKLGVLAVLPPPVSPKAIPDKTGAKIGYGVDYES